MTRSPSELPPPPGGHVGPVASRDDADRAGTSNNPASGGRNGRKPSVNALPNAGAVPSPGSAAELAVGMSHNCVRTTAGEVWCWGHGDSGQLGDGRRSIAKVPRRVPLPQKAVRLATGDPRCAVLADATVACWGGWSKEYGAHNAVPVYIVPGVTDAFSVNVSWNASHKYILRRDGTVLDIAGSKPAAPQPALAGAEEIVQSEANTSETCARMRDKSVRCWRWEVPKEKMAKRKPAQTFSEQDKELVGPTVVPSLAGSLSLANQCALLGDRTVRCWGANGGGEIGDGTTITRSTPVPALGVNGASQLSRGSYTTCAVLADGTARCWGDSSVYPLIPGQPRRLHSTAVPIPLKGIAEIHVAVSHACARLTDGRVACWGHNQFEEVGDGSKDMERPDPSFVVGFGRTAPASDPARSPAPTPTPPTPAQQIAATDIAASGSTTCVRLSDGSPRCWGKNDDGQLGTGTNTNHSRPAAIPYLKSVTAIRPGLIHTCAIATDPKDNTEGAVFCWGANLSGQLGIGNEEPHRVPIRVPGLAGVKQIAVSTWTCALIADGSVKCWGDYDSGVGDPSPSGSKSPTTVAGAAGIVEIAAGGSGACGRTAAGDVRCFGWGSLRELSGGRTPVRTAMPVRGIARAKSISGANAFCAAVEGGNVLCWGGGDVADMDRVHTPDGAWDVWIPVRAKGYDRALDVAVGNDASCERNESREVVCWHDKKIDRPGLRDVTKVAYGEEHACALLGNGEVHCWGKNDVGQLGDGTTTDRPTPVRVLF